jgi:hypothetical protein
MPKIWRIIFPIAALAAVAVAYAGWWQYAAGALKQQLDAFRAEGSRSGATAEWRAMAISGFPLSLDAQFEKPAYTNNQAGFGWRGETLSIHLKPWSLSHLVFSAPGRQSIALAQGSRVITLEGKAGSALVNVVTDLNGALLQTALFVASANYSGRSGGDVVSIRSERLEASLNRPSAVSPGGMAIIEISLLGRGLNIEGVALPLGPNIERLELTASLKDVSADERIGDAEALARWRAAGAPVRIKSFLFVSGGVEATGRGSLKLDANNQPEGELNVTVKGHNRLLDALAAQGFVPMDRVEPARMALGFIAAAGGAKNQVTLPIRFKGGSAYLGPLKIGPAPFLAF